MTKKSRTYLTHRGHRVHAPTPLHRISVGLILPIALVAVSMIVATGVVFLPSAITTQTGTLLEAFGASALRLFAAYVLAVIVGIPLGLLAESNKKLEGALLPVFDVLESMPVLAFFPVIILFFIQQGWAEGAAIFIIFFSMVWNIAFNTIGGIRVTPADVKAAGKVFGLSPFQRFWQITLPALYPPLVTGSILALADGWNILIVAEALHAYAPANVEAHDLFGIGSILVSAAANSDTPLLLSAMAVLVIAIALLNVLIWQPLLARAERYKFE